MTISIEFATLADAPEVVFLCFLNIHSAVLDDGSKEFFFMEKIITTRVISAMQKAGAFEEDLGLLAGHRPMTIRELVDVYGYVVEWFIDRVGTKEEIEEYNEQMKEIMDRHGRRFERLWSSFKDVVKRLDGPNDEDSYPHVLRGAVENFVVPFESSVKEKDKLLSDLDFEMISKIVERIESAYQNAD